MCYAYIAPVVESRRISGIPVRLNANVSSGHQVCSRKGHENLFAARYGIVIPKLPEPFDPKLLKSLTSIVNLQPDIQIVWPDGADMSVETDSGPTRGLNGAPAATLPEAEPVQWSKEGRPR